MVNDNTAIEKSDHIASALQSLAQYEIDGSFIISQAIGSIRNKSLSTELLKLREECENSIEQIGSIIRQYGREAPEHSRDFKGFFMQGYVGMRGLISDKGVMKALKTNAQLISHAYEKALESDLPSDVKDKLHPLQNQVKAVLDYVTSQSS